MILFQILGRYMIEKDSKIIKLYYLILVMTATATGWLNINDGSESV